LPGAAHQNRWAALLFGRILSIQKMMFAKHLKNALYTPLPIFDIIYL